jgi:hypothetical protein
MMIERYIFQLKSLIPDLRREAIEYLAQSADERAIAPLLYTVQHEPIGELRDLANGAVEQIERDAAINRENVSSQSVDPLARYLPKNVNPTDQDRIRAQRHLQQAYNYREGKRTDVALYELAQAIKLNPMLVYDRPVTVLAADLLQSGDSAIQAIVVLLQRIASNGIKPPKREFIDEAGSQYFIRSVIASSVLYLLILLTFMGMTQQPLSLLLLSTNLLPALFGLISVVIADLFMFIVVTILAANTTVNQFMATILASQVPIFALGFVCTVILPIVRVVPVISDAGAITVLVHTNFFTLLVAGGIYFNYQTFFIWRVSKFTADKGLLAAMIGLAVSIIAATIFGLLKNINIG